MWYPKHIKERARELAEEGYKSPEIVSRLSKQFPDDCVGLTDRTVRNWIKQTTVIDEQTTDPLILEAQKEHLDEIRKLIAEWQSNLFIPLPDKIAQKGYEHLLFDIRKSNSFKMLREHLSIPSLWLDDYLLAYLLDDYIHSCYETIRTIARHWNFIPIETKKDIGKQIWPRNSNLILDPIIERMRKRLLNTRESNYGLRLDVLSHVFRTEEKIEKGKSKFLLYVDGVFVGYCFDAEKAKELYGQGSDDCLASEDMIRTLDTFMKIDKLINKIQEQLDEILTRRDYIKTTCRLCPTSEDKTSDNKQLPSWVNSKNYQMLLDNHFSSFIRVGEKILNNLKLFFKLKNRGYRKVTGNIVYGGYLHPPRGEFMTHILEPVDNLQADDVLAHFSYQFPKFDIYGNWGKVTIADIEKRYVNKFSSWLSEGEFKTSGYCLTCHALKEIFKTSDND